MHTPEAVASPARPHAGFTSSVRRRSQRLTVAPEQLALDICSPDAEPIPVAPEQPEPTRRHLSAVPDEPGPLASVDRRTVRGMVRTLVRAGTFARLQGAILTAVVESPNLNADYWRGRISIEELVEATGYSERSVQRALNGDTGTRPLRALISDASDSLRVLHRDGFGVSRSFRYEVPKYRLDVGQLRALIVDLEHTDNADPDDAARGATVAPSKRKENADRNAELWAVAEAGIQLEAEQRYTGTCTLSDLTRNEWRQRAGRPVAIAAERSRRFGAEKAGRNPAKVVGSTVAPQPTAAELAVVSGAHCPIDHTHRHMRQHVSARGSGRPENVA